MIDNALAKAQDLATLEVKLPVEIRMKHRRETIEKLSRANSLNIEGHWKTIPPKFHISNLICKKLSNDHCQIKFGVYEVEEVKDRKGKFIEFRKKEFKNYSYEEIEDEKGNVRTKKKHLSSEYKVEYEVTEDIRSGKALTREKVYIDNYEDR